jgi:hypothetical protein
MGAKRSQFFNVPAARPCILVDMRVMIDALRIGNHGESYDGSCTPGASMHPGRGLGGGAMIRPWHSDSSVLRDFRADGD